MKLKRFLISMLVGFVASAIIVPLGTLTSPNEVNWEDIFDATIITGFVVGWLLYQVSIKHLTKKSDIRMALEGTIIAFILMILLFGVF